MRWHDSDERMVSYRVNGHSFLNGTRQFQDSAGRCGGLQLRTARNFPLECWRVFPVRRYATAAKKWSRNCTCIKKLYDKLLTVVVQFLKWLLLLLFFWNLFSVDILCHGVYLAIPFPVYMFEHYDRRCWGWDSQSFPPRSTGGSLCALHGWNWCVGNEQVKINSNAFLAGQATRNEFLML